MKAVWHDGTMPLTVFQLGLAISPYTWEQVYNDTMKAVRHDDTVPLTVFQLDLAVSPYRRIAVTPYTSIKLFMPYCGITTLSAVVPY